MGLFPTNCLASQDGIPGLTEKSATINSNEPAPDSVLFTVMSATNEPGVATWSAGTWRARINITDGRDAVLLNSVFVCRLNAAGESIATVTNEQGIGLSTTQIDGGIYEVSWDVPEISAATTNRVGVAFGFITAAGTPRTIGITPDQYIVTPIGTNDQDLTGRTLCHGMYYSEGEEQGFIDVNLTGRTLGAATTRADAETVDNNVYNELTGRTLCHGLYYTSSVEANPATNVALTGRTLGRTYTRGSTSLPSSDVDLTGRTLCHGLYYSVEPEDIDAVDLTGRTACVSWWGGTAASEIGVSNRELTGRTMSTVFFQADGRILNELSARTLCVPTFQGDLNQVGLATNISLEGRTLSLSLMRGVLTQPGMATNVELTGRTFSPVFMRGNLTLQERAPDVYGDLRAFIKSYSRIKVKI